MSQEPLPFELGDTITAAWHQQVAGPDGARAHWRTKVRYYQAVARLLRTSPGPVTWQDVVATTRPRGSRSTFYEVTGPRSKRALIDDFVELGESDSLQIALAYRRHNAVDQLIDEAKVWSYWPYREGWVSACRSAPDLTVGRATDAMIAVLGEWAHQDPALAAALGHAPPICAVEDLIRLGNRQLPAIRAQATLREAMLSVLSPGGGRPDHDVDPDLGPHRPVDAGTTAHTLVLRLAETIYALRREAVDLAPRDVRTIRDTIAVLFADAVVVAERGA